MTRSQIASDGLLEAARQLFAERGFGGAGTREIAALAGVNQGLVRYHFGGKEGLWKQVVGGALTRVRERLEAPTTAFWPDDLVAVLAAERPLVQTAFHELAADDGPRRRWLIGELSSLADALRAALASAGGSGPPSDVLLLSWLSAAAGFAAFAPVLLGAPPGPQTLRVHAELLGRWLRDDRPHGAGPWSIPAARRAGRIG